MRDLRLQGEPERLGCGPGAIFQEPIEGRPIAQQDAGIGQRGLHHQFLLDGCGQLPAPVEGDEGHSLAIEPANEGGGFLRRADGLGLALGQGGNKAGVLEFAQRLEGIEAKSKGDRRGGEGLPGDRQALGRIAVPDGVVEEDFAGRHGDLRIARQRPGQPAAMLAAAGILGDDFPAHELELAGGIGRREAGRGSEMLKSATLLAPGEREMGGGGLVGSEVAFCFGDAAASEARSQRGRRRPRESRGPTPKPSGANGLLPGFIGGRKYPPGAGRRRRCRGPRPWRVARRARPSVGLLFQEQHEPGA